MTGAHRSNFEGLLMTFESDFRSVDNRPDRSVARTGKQAVRSTARWLAVVASMLCGAHVHAAGDAASGKTVFANQCASCHTTEVGKNGFGPSLAAVLGRKAGGLGGF